MKKLIAFTAAAALGLGAWFLVLVDRPPLREQEQRPGVELMAMPTKALRRCRAQSLLARACPTQIPRVSADAGHYRFADASDPRGHYDVVSVEWSGPYPGLTPKNGPPRFAHVVVVGGDVDGASSFEWPGERGSDERPTDGERRAPALLGRPEWRGEGGTLVLAPSFAWGGIHGDHLVFRWAGARGEFAVSLHAWRPLEEAVATLRALVLSASERAIPHRS